MILEFHDVTSKPAIVWDKFNIEMGEGVQQKERERLRCNEQNSTKILFMLKPSQQLIMRVIGP